MSPRLSERLHWLNDDEVGFWAGLVIGIWKADADVRREFSDNLIAFFDWTYIEAERLIRSATENRGYVL